MEIKSVEQEPTILDIAKTLVFGARNKDYGHPKDNFQNIADLWNSYLDIVDRERSCGGVVRTGITPIDIACLNILQKIARLATNPIHRDSIVDIAGYAATIERIVDSK